MTREQTFDKLYRMKLHGMAKALEEHLKQPDMASLSFEERLAMLVDAQWLWRENRLRNAKLKQQASIEDISFRHPRQLDRSLIRSLSSCDWVRERHNVALSGPSGIGKTFICCALLEKVCRMKFSRDPQERGWIQITDDYWPYERTENRKTDDPELCSYLDQIRNILAERACIRTPFSTTDELLAREWYAQGVTIEYVGQAVLMGCARKYVSWRNGAPRTPIGSLAYFQPILAEVKDQNAPADYWEFTRQRIERMEKLWISGDDPDRFVRPCPPGDTKIPNGGISGHGSGQDR
jgi:hypothetical protein